jgi:beta-barrel assembly-enhancing protease
MPRFHRLFLRSLLTLSMTAWPLAMHSEVLPSPTATIDNGLPSLGDANTQSLSPRAEKRLGDRIMRSIRQDPLVMDDPLIAEYINTQWASLLNSARQRGEIGSELDEVYAWQPFLVRDKSINAFALPGGFIGIHLGLIAGTRSRDELAAVLAHELSHVTQRHIARMMGQAKRTSWVSMASMVLGAIAASRSPEAAQALIIGGQGLSAQSELNFSRDMEREADRIGFGVMGQAGYDPAGMMQMFEQLQQASRLNDDNSFPYLRTHPLTSERIGEARSRMGNQSLSTPALPDSGLYHALITARAKVLMDPRSLSLQPLLKAPDAQLSGKPLMVHQYTRLVAATQLKDRTSASQALASLWPMVNALRGSEALALQRLLTLSDIEMLLETGRVAQAQALMQSSKATARPEALLFAQAALAAPDAASNTQNMQTAAAQLQTLTSQQPEDVNAWALLSSLWGRLGQPLRALRADAEASAARGDLQGAIDRADAARKRFTTSAHADLIEQSVMDTRLREWRKTLKEDEKETL